MQKLKRGLALLMALIMLIPPNIVTAKEMTGLDVPDESGYTVSILDVDNGDICFSDDDSLTERKLKEGEKVSLEMTPDEDYEVSEFTILDAADNSVIASMETTDNQFSFSMPDYDIIVTGKFDTVCFARLKP